MKYIIDHDLHIHSNLSHCSKDPLQTPENILQYAIDNHLSHIVLTDHMWDAQIPHTIAPYDTQNYEHVSSALPLPTSDSVTFGFGCEVDMDENLVIGLHENMYDKFDFIIVPTTHMHYFVDKDASLEERARLYVKRFEAFLDANLPFYKVGIAHLTCYLIARQKWEDHITVIDMIPDETFRYLFERTSKCGAGVELNMPIFKYNESERQRILRPYRIAKECGCKFYFGSDAHKLTEFETATRTFEYIVDLLQLEEKDKWRPRPCI